MNLVEGNYEIRIKYLEEIIASGELTVIPPIKPEKIVDKIIEGKMSKFFKEQCLLNQPYVRDPDITISDLLNTQARHKWGIFYHKDLDLVAPELIKGVRETFAYFHENAFKEHGSTAYEILVLPDEAPDGLLGCDVLEYCFRSDELEKSIPVKIHL